MNRSKEEAELLIEIERLENKIFAIQFFKRGNKEDLTMLGVKLRKTSKKLKNFSKWDFNSAVECNVDNVEAGGSNPPSPTNGA